MAVGIWVLNDQLDLNQSALASAQPGEAKVLLIESLSVLYSGPHIQKQILFWAAQRHFAEELRGRGWSVDLLEVPTHTQALLLWLGSNGISELRVMVPSDRPIKSAIEQIAAGGLDKWHLRWYENNQFLWSNGDFSEWAGTKKQLRLEFFYRESRKRFNVLMDGDQPLGEQWNFDKENRKPPRKGLVGPPPKWFSPDDCTEAVIEKLEKLRTSHQLSGNSRPFQWAVNRLQAQEVVEHFIATRLADFGPYQDAMVEGEPTLWHGLFSPYLNLGLLNPLELLRRLEAAGLEQRVPLASLEGVVRQILGWREFTNGLYHHFGETYPFSNALEATVPLPPFITNLGVSGMNCVDIVLGELSKSGYLHHIQRLMVLGNLGLIAGWDPQAYVAWFTSKFVDAHDWVMQTNVIGMGLWADGGMLASKPYAASGKYLQRMGTYCKSCSFDPTQRSGAKACPFTVLYWNFLAKHSERFRNHPRMALMIKQLEKFSLEEREAIKASAARFEWAQGDSAP
jgi:deoxyribodipyrimidine photolyase-related protein